MILVYNYNSRKPLCLPSYDADPDLGKDPDSNKGGCKNVHNVNNEK